MTVLTNRGTGFEALAGTAHALPVPIEASTADVATLELLADEEFMERFRTGVAQLERGELRSFEEIFGEPL